MHSNKMSITFSALSQNESFARAVAGAFASQLNPTVSEIADIKTAVSEAVTNCVIHAYGGKGGAIEMSAEIRYGNESTSEITIEVRDWGSGIADVARAREPFYTTCGGDERSGMGFTVMETFMDALEVDSAPGKGTTVRMRKTFAREDGE